MSITRFSAEFTTTIQPMAGSCSAGGLAAAAVALEAAATAIAIVAANATSAILFIVLPPLLLVRLFP